MAHGRVAGGDPHASAYLTLAQVFDALRYYAENQGQINRAIEANRVPDELVHPLFQREQVAA